MDRIDHGDEIIMGNIVHDAVAAAGNPSATGLEGLHMIPDVAFDIGRTPLYKRPGDVDIAKERQAIPISLLVIPIIDPRRVHGVQAIDPQVD